MAALCAGRRRPRRRHRGDRDGLLRVLNGDLFRLGSARRWGHIAPEPALADLSLAELFLQPQGDGERHVPACAEPGDGDPVRVDAQLRGVVDEVEHRVHPVLDRRGERVLGRTPVMHAAHDRVGVRDDRGCPSRVVLGPTKRKTPAVEVHNDGIAAFVRVGFDAVDISVSFEVMLVMGWCVERESDLSLIWRDGGIN